MRPVELYILLALARGDLHGYGIIQATERQSGGAVRLDPGTLYRAIGRLREAGFVDEANRTAAADLHGRRRRYYTLTEPGRAAAAVEAARLADLVQVAVDVDLLGKPGWTG